MAAGVAPLGPPPFEDRSRIPGFWKRVGLTFTLAFRSPMTFYEGLPQGTGLLGPWRFKVLLMAPWYLFAILILGLFSLIAALAVVAAPMPPPRAVLLVGPALGAGILLLGPLVQLAAMLLGGLLQHLLLWLWGGARAGVPLRQTIRAAGYTQAMVGLCALVPIIGPFAYLGGKVVLGLGLARLHRTAPWRALGAAFSHCLVTLLAVASVLATLAMWLIRMDIRDRQIILPPATAEPAPEEPAPSGPGRI